MISKRIKTTFTSQKIRTNNHCNKHHPKLTFDNNSEVGADGVHHIAGLHCELAAVASIAPPDSDGAVRVRGLDAGAVGGGDGGLVVLPLHLRCGDAGDGNVDGEGGARHQRLLHHAVLVGDLGPHCKGSRNMWR